MMQCNRLDSIPRRSVKDMRRGVPGSTRSMIRRAGAISHEYVVVPVVRDMAIGHLDHAGDNSRRAPARCTVRVPALRRCRLANTAGPSLIGHRADVCRRGELKCHQVRRCQARPDLRPMRGSGRTIAAHDLCGIDRAPSSCARHIRSSRAASVMEARHAQGRQL